MNTLPNGVRLAREMPFILHKMAWEYWRILNTLPNEVTHLTLAPALTLHANILAFTFVNHELRNFSSDKVTPNILIINDLTCHLSLVTYTITHREGPTQYTVPLQSWLFLHVLEAPLQCLEG